VCRCARRPCAAARTDARAQLPGRDTRRGSHVDLVEAARFVDHALRLGRDEHSRSGAAERFTATELDDPTIA